jgi:hypothetical protein
VDYLTDSLRFATREARLEVRRRELAAHWKAIGLTSQAMEIERLRSLVRELSRHLSQPKTAYNVRQRLLRDASEASA